MEAVQIQIEPSGSSLSDECIQVPIDLVEELWTVLAPILEPSIKWSHGKVTLEDVRTQSIEGFTTIWVQYLDGEPAAVLVTAIEVHPQKKVFKILLAAGRDARRWTASHERFEEAARELGCDSIEAVGRRGWGRLYPDYKEIETIFSKEL